MKKLFTLLLAMCITIGLVACSSTPATKEITFEEQVLLDNEYITFTITDAPKEDFWGQSISVYLENKTDKTLMYALDNVSVNGYMVDVLFATEVEHDKKENTSITIFSNDLEKNKIETVENITFNLRVYDSNDWMAEPIIDSVEYIIDFN